MLTILKHHHLIFFDFSSVLQFLSQSSYTYFVRFIPNHSYFSLFGANINGSGFLISNSYWSLLVYKKAIHFCVLTLYLATMQEPTAYYIVPGSFQFCFFIVCVFCRDDYVICERFYFFLPNLYTLYFLVLLHQLALPVCC